MGWHLTVRLCLQAGPQLLFGSLRPELALDCCRAESSIVNCFCLRGPPAGPGSPRFTAYLYVLKLGPLVLAKDQIFLSSSPTVPFPPHSPHPLSLSFLRSQKLSGWMLIRLNSGWKVNGLGLFCKAPSLWWVLKFETRNNTSTGIVSISKNFPKHSIF